MHVAESEQPGASRTSRSTSGATSSIATRRAWRARARSSPTRSPSGVRGFLGEYDEGGRLRRRRRRAQPRGRGQRPADGDGGTSREWAGRQFVITGPRAADRPAATGADRRRRSQHPDPDHAARARGVCAVRGAHRRAGRSPEQSATEPLTRGYAGGPRVRFLGTGPPGALARRPLPYDQAITPPPRRLSPDPQRRHRRPRVLGPDQGQGADRARAPPSRRRRGRRRGTPSATGWPTAGDDRGQDRDADRRPRPGAGCCRSPTRDRGRHRARRW